MTSERALPGTLTFGYSNSSKDLYSFHHRAAHIAHVRISSGLKDNDPFPGGPWTLEIEPTSICDRKCHYCSYKVANNQHISHARISRQSDLVTQPYLPFKVIKDLLQQLKEGGSTRGIFYAGGGESLTYPHIIDAILLAREFSQVSLQTNGIKLDKLAHAELLKALKIISVSVDSHTPELYREMANVDQFHRVTENIRHVLALQKQHNIPLTFGVKILVSPLNYMYLPEIVNYYRHILGVENISIRLTQNYHYGQEKPREDDVELTYEQKQMLKIQIQTRFSDDPLMAAFSNKLLDENLRPDATRLCFNAAHSHFAVVDPTGNVVLGNPEVDNKEAVIGNVNQSPWNQIWGSERHRTVMDNMNQQQTEGKCPIHLCRHAKANIGAQQFEQGTLTDINSEEIMSNHGAFM